MKRVIGLLSLVIILGAGYRYAFAKGPESAYKAFAEEILNRRYDAAAGMAEGLSAADLAREGTQEHIAGPAMFQTLFPSRFTIDSREDAPDGGVILHATQTVLFNPVGVESAVRPAMFATMKQVVTLRKANGNWRVTAFSNSFDKMDSVTGR